MTAFTMNTVTEYVRDQLSDLSNVSFTPRQDIADTIRDALESNGFEALETTYDAEAWDVVAGSDFTRFNVSCDFSDCKNALECLKLEADEILREAYHQQLDSILNTVAACVEEAFTPGESDFKGASGFYIDEIQLVKGCSLGSVSHSFEYDLTAGEGNAESVCVWLPQRRLYFKVHGMEFIAELLEDDAE